MVAAPANADLTAAPSSRHLAGHGLGHGAEDGVADTKPGQAAGRHRSRVLRVHDTSFRGRYVEGPEEAAVGLDGRVDKAFHHGVDVGLGVGEVGVDGSLGLRRSAVEVHENLAALDLDLGVYLDGVHVDAVVVDVVGELPLPLGQQLDLGPGQAFGGVQDVGHVALEFFQAVVVHQPQQVSLAEPDRRQQRLDVAQDFVGHPDVLLQDAPDRLVQLALLVELDGRDDQPFLVDLSVVAGVAPGHAAADVGLVADAAAPGNQHIVLEDRLEEKDVGQVAGPFVGVVIGEDVSRQHVVAKGVHHTLQRRGHGTQVGRRGQTLGHL